LDYLTDYLDHLAFERGLSPLTRENYARDIRLLLNLADKATLQDLKTIVLINEALLIHGARRVQSGKKCHYTTRGPFWQGEDIARERLHKKEKKYAGRQPGVKLPNTYSLRLTPFNGKTEQ